MTRSYDAIPDEADRSAEYTKPSDPVMSVCPFCGAISEKSEVPCPRCKMENSALTRQATRARIGPWYVMQARNPSAPGMKCNTLLALIRKGQITPRSVIRGPTTFQLWRFAARVKGISREFGLCYSCGAELQRISTFCPRCSRSQELPPNPDVLLENEPQSKTVYRQVNQRPESPAAAPLEPLPQQARPPATEANQDRPPRPTTQIPSAAETMAELADIPSPHSAPPEMQSRPRQRPQEGILTPRELAAAFSIQYDPTMDSSGKPRRERGGWGLVVAAVLLLMVGGGLSVFYFMPTLRARFIAFLQGSSTPPAVSPQTSPPPTKSVPDGNPPWMNYVPDETPPITTVNKPSSVDLSNAPSSTSTAASNWNNSPAAPPVVNPTPVPQPPPPAPVAIAQNLPPAPSNPPPSNDNSTATPAPIPNDPGTAAAAETFAKLKQSCGDDLDSLAMKLRNNGLDAEAKQDYTSARYFYEQVESLPADHWPSDIDRLLKSAEKHFGDPR
jgi:hypothetical protein